MFSGLSAFPLTPVRDNRIDEAAFVRLVERLVAARVDTISSLGSTGSYAYLTRQERLRIVQLTVRHAAGLPVMVGIGATGTREVISLAEDAQRAGATAVLLAPVSYQKLAPDEVYSLYEAVTQNLSVPLCVYDNPTTTHFEFSDELHGRIAQLPNVASVKIPALPGDPDAAKGRVERLRTMIPSHVTIGVSGDASAARGLIAGCEVWYSVIGGLFPQVALEIVRAVQGGDVEEAERASERLRPIWALFAKHGSLRVVAAAAELLELVKTPSLLAPVKAIEGADRQELAQVLDRLELS